MSSDDQQGRDEPDRGLSRAQKKVIGYILVLAAVNVAYRLVYASGQSRTAALYVGVPTLLAIGLTALPRTKSATGMLLRGSTLAMLIACVVLPEGILCLIFAVPLVAVISVVVGGAIDLARRRGHREGPTLMAVSLPLLLMSLEGLALSPFDRHDAASATVTVDASVEEVAAALAATPTFDADLPFFLTAGFNRPVRATGAGIDVGDPRTIEFSGGTHDEHPLRLLGLVGRRDGHHHSHMQLTVVESTPGRIVFRVDEDTTMLARWARLTRAVVTWEAVDDGTRVTWRLEYERLLDPMLYFAPVQRYGMGEAAQYLLNAVIKAPTR